MLGSHSLARSDGSIQSHIRIGNAKLSLMRDEAFSWWDEVHENDRLTMMPVNGTSLPSCLTMKDCKYPGSGKPPTLDNSDGLLADVGYFGYKYKMVNRRNRGTTGTADFDGETFNSSLVMRRSDDGCKCHHRARERE